MRRLAPSWGSSDMSVAKSRTLLLHHTERGVDGVDNHLDTKKCIYTMSIIIYVNDILQQYYEIIYKH